MNRSIRTEKAQETLKIIEQGFYLVEGKKIELKNELEHAFQFAELYKTGSLDTIITKVNEKLQPTDSFPEISIENTTVLKAAEHLINKGFKVGCLNFASAKNPGGGFLGGAQAQEESLALSSTLYPTLMKHFEMYEYNRGRSTSLYSDYMIYSPDVIVFRNDDGELLSNPYSLCFVTSPAVNIGAMKANRPEELLLAEEVMMQRMDKILALFFHHNIKHLLLGAWGCGVFQNDANDVARYFASYLLRGGKYSGAFESVTFAILDKSKEGKNMEAFESAFKK